jgi:hypothetical protein
MHSFFHGAAVKIKDNAQEILNPTRRFEAAQHEAQGAFDSYLFVSFE